MTEQRRLTVHEDDLVRRFLFGDVTPDERERIEARLAGDHEYFEALCAFEDELVADYARGTLPAPVRDRFTETLAAYPRRGERLREIESLRAVLAESSLHSLVSRRAPWRVAVYAAGVLAAGVILAVILRGVPGSHGHGQPNIGVDLGRSPTDPEVKTFVLALGQTRDSSGQTRSFPNPGPSGFVDLVVDLPSRHAALRATLTRVGNPTVVASGEPRLDAPADGTQRIAWRVSSSTVSAGDYLLTLFDADETVASAYFRVLR